MLKLPFDRVRSTGFNHVMIVTVDEQRRVPLPDSAQPGQAFELKEAGPSSFVLTRVEQRAGVQLQRKDGHLVASTPHIITQAETRQAVDEFP